MRCMANITGAISQALAAPIALLVLGGCAHSPSYISVHRVPPSRLMADDLASIASGPSISRDSRQLLARLQIRWRPESCQQIFEAVADSPGPLYSRLLTLSELTLAAADSRGCPIPRRRLLLNAARLAYGQLMTATDGEEPVGEPLLIGFYNRAVAELLTDGERQSLADRAASLGIVTEPDSAGLATRFDRVVDADRLAFSGLRSRHRRYGIGAALVGLVTQPSVAWRSARAMDGGYAQPVTALLHFDGQDNVSLQVLDASVSGFIGNDRYFPLHADLTAPYAWQLSHSRMRALETPGALRPARVAHERGLLLLEPFDPDRIPVLMIHGFWSSPQAWRDITNELLATPGFRDRFQIWHYFYPTGTNYLYSAGLLRAELAAFLAELRAAHGWNAVKPMVVIGHSEGGLLARSLVTSSGWALWDTVFRVSLPSLAAPPAARDTFLRTLFYEPLPDVDTVVLMATPNAGTRSIHHSLRAMLINALTDLPDDVAHALRALARQHPEQLRLESRGWFRRGGMTALESMAPDNPLMTVFARLPLDPRVHVHSIVALRPTADGESDGDEFVRRSSQQLPQAESELLVTANHQDIDGGEVLAELQRILLLRVARDQTRLIRSQWRGPDVSNSKR